MINLIYLLVGYRRRAMFVIWTWEEFNFVSDEIERVVIRCASSFFDIIRSSEQRIIFLFWWMERKDEIGLTGGAPSGAW